MNVPDVKIGTRPYPVVAPWRGEKIAPSPAVAVDTEFSVDKPHRLALVSAFDGERAYLIRPEDFAAFYAQLVDRVLVMHNCACDWVVLRDNVFTQPSPRRHWLDTVTDGRISDTMIRDMLIRLARDAGLASGDWEDKSGSAAVSPRSLAKLGEQYLKTAKDNEDPYRMRFGELVGKDWETADEGFFRYAALDPVITWFVWQEQQGEMYSLVEPYLNKLPPGVVARNGLLTERIQVEGAVALQCVTDNGIGLDREKISQASLDIKESLTRIEEYLISSHPDVLPPVYGPRCKVNVPGTRPRTDDGLLSLTGLQAKLTGIAIELRLDDVPRTATGAISKSAETWSPYAEDHAFLGQWLEYNKLSKLYTFFTSYRDKERVHPRYNILAKTGRTTSYSPNLQQVPKGGKLRSCFVPPPGVKLWVGDLSGAELCTFAAHAKAAYGFSTMGDQLAAGKNVHAYFASRIMGIDYADFLKLKDTDPETFKRQRQIAKPANFGLMGGMMVDSLIAYAKGPAYKVHLTEEQAETLIAEWEEAFPEGKLHRSKELEIQALAKNLRCSEVRVRAWVKGKHASHLHMAELTLAGRKARSGYSLPPASKRELWADMLRMCKDEKITAALRTGKADPRIAEAVFRRDSLTITGRLAGNVRYTQLRNYCFQGLAGDIKRAIWRLVAKGVKVVGFIHDEILCEVLTREEGEMIARTIEDTMTELCGGTVPFTVEWHLSDCWEKP